MCNQLRITNKLDKFVSDTGEVWFISQELIGNPVYCDRFLINFPFGVDVDMKCSISKTAINHFDTADLDHPMPIIWVEARGLRIKNYLPHSETTPLLASSSARSLPG